MKVFLASFLISMSAMAVEVATVEDTKDHTQVMFAFTDESLYGALDKLWIPHPCKTRFIINNSVREYYTLKACKAEVVKFLLNSGYKTIDLGRTFIK